MSQFSFYTLLILLALGFGITAITMLFMGADTWMAAIMACSSFSLATLPMFIDHSK